MTEHRYIRPDSTHQRIDQVAHRRFVLGVALIFVGQLILLGVVIALDGFGVPAGWALSSIVVFVVSVALLFARQRTDRRTRP